MFSPFGQRSASAYQRINVEASSHTIDQYQLVSLLFEGFLSFVVVARGALARNDVLAKCNAVSKALRVLEEGLLTGLDTVDGGELASNLEALYTYATQRLVLANARNDDAIFLEVQTLIETVAKGWKEMKPSTPNPNPKSVAAPAAAPARSAVGTGLGGLSLVGA